MLLTQFQHMRGKHIRGNPAAHMKCWSLIRRVGPTLRLLLCAGTSMVLEDTAANSVFQIKN